MNEECKKYWRVGLACRPGQPLSSTMEHSLTTPGAHGLSGESVSPTAIAFGVQAKGCVPIPGYDAPALPLKPPRDPSLSLIALSGVDPSGPVMVEVPLVQNNTTFTPSQTLADRRLGFADRWVRGHEYEPIQHSAAFLNALGILRRAGAQLVAVPAQRPDETLRVTQQTYNEIDAHVSEYRLDALVSDSHNAAFLTACWNGYPRVGEPLGEGQTLWFYGTRWSGDALVAVMQTYRRVCCLSDV
ncbi:hypothetical protein HX792_21550 [Pseudomonas sp. B6002]|uniref:hypothetical protein n=1 Tax=Pseudomonas sp. B6002 TaxID=2726978 RepID=UPI0015A0EE1C|nr:hypothetical protein [Pseudomonas sp. B6002]NVZ52941.1 hypothetical protein [Pseudomonas sp. B6002]